MEDAITRPDEPRHFMVIKPVDRRVRVRDIRGEIIADSTQTIRLLESGRTLYDPVLYFPRSDVIGALVKEAKTTLCPLKGHATYYQVNNQENAAWSYEAPFEFSNAIKGLVAFPATWLIPSF